MVTMKQIANRAGVSISTVSLVLNNRDIGRVSPDVAERVRDIAAELGYLTNRSGQRAAHSSTRHHRIPQRRSGHHAVCRPHD